MRDRTEEKLLLAAIVALVMIIVGVLIWAQRDQDRWEDWCTAQGGIVTDSTSTGTTVVVNPKGGPGIGTTTGTTHYCIVDGKLIDTK